MNTQDKDNKIELKDWWSLLGVMHHIEYIFSLGQNLAERCSTLACDALSTLDLTFYDSKEDNVRMIRQGWWINAKCWVHFTPLSSLALIDWTSSNIIDLTYEILFGLLSCKGTYKIKSHIPYLRCKYQYRKAQADKFWPILQLHIGGHSGLDAVSWRSRLHLLCGPSLLGFGKMSSDLHRSDPLYIHHPPLLCSIIKISYHSLASCFKWSVRTFESMQNRWLNLIGSIWILPSVCGYWYRNWTQIPYFSSCCVFGHHWTEHHTVYIRNVAEDLQAETNFSYLFCIAMEIFERAPCQSESAWRGMIWEKWRLGSLPI